MPKVHYPLARRGGVTTTLEPTLIRREPGPFVTNIGAVSIVATKRKRAKRCTHLVGGTHAGLYTNTVPNANHNAHNDQNVAHSAQRSARSSASRNRRRLHSPRECSENRSRAAAVSFSAVARLLACSRTASATPPSTFRQVKSLLLPPAPQS